MKATVNHIEIPVLDLLKAKTFYKNIFGWDMDTESMGGSYGIVQEKGYASIGFPVKEKIPKRGIHVVFEVDNIDETLETIKKNGGKIEKVKYEIAPEIGCAGEFLDCFGNWLGLFSSPGK